MNMQAGSSRGARLLVAATAVSSIGDGLGYVALPLLTASVSSDPTHVAMVVAAQHLPWLAFGVRSGIVADRSHAPRLMVRADLCRALVFGVVGLASIQNAAALPLLVVTAFLVGTADTFFDPASNVLVPHVSTPSEFAAINSRLTAVQAIGQAGAGPLLGGVLYSVARPLPFLLNAMTFAASALLVRRITFEGSPSETPPPENIRGAVRWFLSCRPLVVLTVLTGILATAGSMVNSTLVLLGTQEFGLSPTQYGFFYVGGSAGSVLGSIGCERAWARLGTSVTVLVSALAIAGAYALLSATTIALLAAGALFAEALAIPTLNIVNATLRQRLAGDRVGQATSVFRLAVLGSLPFGALLGGLVGSSLSLRAVPAVAAVGAALGTALLAPALKRQNAFDWNPRSSERCDLDQSPN